MEEYLLDFTPRICFGGAAVSGEGAGYGFGEIDDKTAEVLLKSSYERGIRVFDTAPIYGFGLSEQRIGRAFKNIRDKVFIVSKSGVTWDDNKRVDVSNDSKTTESMLNSSLKKLGGFIDLYMVHWPDSRVDIRTTLEVLIKAKECGKIGHIGLSNTYMDDLKLAEEVCQIEVIQGELNIFHFDSYYSLKEYMELKKINYMSWGTFDKGIITGRVTKNRTFQKSDARSWAPWWKQSDKGRRMDVMAKLLPCLEKIGGTGVQFALSYNHSRGESVYPICGIKSLEQLDSTMNSLNSKMSDYNLQTILELMNEG